MKKALKLYFNSTKKWLTNLPWVYNKSIREFKTENACKIIGCSLGDFHHVYLFLIYFLENNINPEKFGFERCQPIELTVEFTSNDSEILFLISSVLDETKSNEEVVLYKKILNIIECALEKNEYETTVFFNEKRYSIKCKVLKSTLSSVG